jgi:ornithine carbamoyltransferase
MKQFISVKDVTNINELVQKALMYKSDPVKDILLGKNKRIGLLFLNPSLRTRLSTQLAAQNLGMEPIVYNVDKEGWSLEFNEGAIMNGTTVEHIKDAGQLKNKKPKVVLTWAPHIKSIPQCVANSFSQWMTAWGEADFVITHPKGYELSTEYTNGATILNDQDEALKDADFVYVKNWSCYHDYGKVLTTDESWMLTNEKLLNTNDAKVMHCLPVRRNVELSDEILDGNNSLVTKEASNRVWAAQAVLSEILKNNA